MARVVLDSEEVSLNTRSRGSRGGILDSLGNWGGVLVGIGKGLSSVLVGIGQGLGSVLVGIGQGLGSVLVGIGNGLSSVSKGLGIGYGPALSVGRSGADGEVGAGGPEARSISHVVHALLESVAVNVAVAALDPGVGVAPLDLGGVDVAVAVLVVAELILRMMLAGGGDVASGGGHGGNGSGGSGGNAHGPGYWSDGGGSGNGNGRGDVVNEGLGKVGPVGEDGGVGRGIGVTNGADGPGDGPVELGGGGSEQSGQKSLQKKIQ